MNIDRFNEPGSEQSVRHAKPRRDCRSNHEYQLRKREATRDFRKYILDNYNELAWHRGIHRMSNDDRDRMRAFMSPGEYQERRKTEGIRNRIWQPATDSVAEFVDEIRKGRYRWTPPPIEACDYRIVEQGIMSLSVWADARRSRDWKDGLKNIKPSNSRKRLRCSVRTGRLSDCGLSRPDHCRAVKYYTTGSGRVPVKGDIECVLTVMSNWRQHWATKPNHHGRNPDKHLIVAAQDRKHLYGRECAEVTYVKSQQGCHYTNNRAWCAKYGGAFIFGTSRRNLETKYIKRITDVILEARFDHLTEGLKDKNGKLDKMTAGSLRQGVMDDALVLFHAGVDSPSSTLQDYDTMKGNN